MLSFLKLFLVDMSVLCVNRRQSKTTRIGIDDQLCTLAVSFGTIPVSFQVYCSTQQMTVVENYRVPEVPLVAKQQQKGS